MPPHVPGPAPDVPASLARPSSGLPTIAVESAAGHRTDFDDTCPAGLASLYREVSTLAGRPADRNTELLPRV